jgi:hypothetical protein
MTHFASRIVTLLTSFLLSATAWAGNPECFTSGIRGEELVCAAVTQPAAALVSGTLTSAAGSTALRGPTTPLRRMDGIGTSGISCVSWGKRHDCFVRATDRTLYSRAFLDTGVYSDWLGLGAPEGGLLSEPSCVAITTARIDCFVRAGNASSMWQLSWDGARWGAWTNRRGELIAPPRCFTRGPRSIDCVARFRGGALMHIIWNGTDWSAWRRVAPAVIGRPDCVVFSAAELRCYVINGAGRFTQWILNGDRWVAGTPPPHPDPFAPFRGDVDCAASAGAAQVVCAWNSEIVGIPYVIAAKLDARGWTNFKGVWIGVADRLSCTASATFPTQFVCGFTPPGGGAFWVIHWNGDTVGTRTPLQMADWGFIRFPETVKTDY